MFFFLTAAITSTMIGDRSGRVVFTFHCMLYIKHETLCLFGFAIPRRELVQLKSVGYESPPRVFDIIIFYNKSVHKVKSKKKKKKNRENLCNLNRVTNRPSR